jgi:hypothetical protein
MWALSVTAGGRTTECSSNVGRVGYFYPVPIPFVVVVDAVRNFHGIAVVVRLSPLLRSHLSLSWAGIFVFAFVFLLRRGHWAVRVRCFVALAVLRGAEPSSRVAGDESRFSEVYSTHTDIVGISIYHPSHFLLGCSPSQARRV